MNEPSLNKKTKELKTTTTLSTRIEKIKGDCLKCGKCSEQCEFLNFYGMPGEIAEVYDGLVQSNQHMPFKCSLCGLCAGLCDEKIDPASMFIEMRKELFKNGTGCFDEHKPLLNFERRGTSSKYTYYALPDGCDTIFFPGCSLPGTHLKQTIKIIDLLRKIDPLLGIVLDCCAKPSHDLGRNETFENLFGEMKDYLLSNGIRNVIVACPNCFKIFKTYGGKLSVITLYEILAQNSLPDQIKTTGTVTVHDPCPVRFEKNVHSAVRSLILQKGLKIEEMEHHGETTICCGEGGAVPFFSAEYAKKWGDIRKNESKGNRIITYCAGCSNYLGAYTETSHIVDLMINPAATMAGETKASKAPFTYINRLRLKKHIKKTFLSAVTRERSITEANYKKTLAVKFLILALIIGSITAINYTDLSRFLDHNTLREWIDGYGLLAPVIYMLLYVIGPVLLLPGIPITLAGGILFGPFWGVIYTITSSTTGACMAFLISRHLARDFVESRLSSPKWKTLDKGIEKHGWKVVAFARLVPVFPFNLLNYALGLTKIKFWHYAVTTFFCMLPACIAFIVFSSSLLDLLKGNVSKNFLIGAGLVVIISSIPSLYRLYKEKTENSDPL